MAHIRYSSQKRISTPDSKYAISINFKEEVYADFRTIINKVQDVLEAKIPKNEKLLCIWVDDHGAGTKMVYDKRDPSKIDHVPLEGLTWEALEQEVPEIVEFYKKYPLEKSFVQVRDSTAPPHRHRYSTSSCWTLTFINCTHDGILKFYEPKDPDNFNDAINIRWNMNIWNCLDRFVTKAHSAYALDTWNWHGWNTKGVDPIITNFCIKDASSNETTKAIVDQYFNVPKD